MNSHKNIGTTHAERDAISKLPFRKSKKCKKINILVIRTTKIGTLSNSKPCYHCIMDMINITPKYGYKINNVYYSTDDGSITKTKLSELYKSGDYHYSSFHRVSKMCNNNKKELKTKNCFK